MDQWTRTSLFGVDTLRCAVFNQGMAKRTVRDVALGGKRVLVRVDYNVPMEEKDGVMVVNDHTRILETLPTLRYLIEQGARVVLMAHLGRPKGQKEPALSLKPVAAKLAELLGRPVAFCETCIGDAAGQAVESLKDGEVLLLENVRYHAEEELNDPQFAAELAQHADVYVNDAFGAAHRAHASTHGVAEQLRSTGRPCVAGLLMERELKFLGEELDQPARPFVVILGGAKVSDKIKVIDRLLDKADTILIGGAMAYTFKLAHGGQTGKSLVEPDHTSTALAAEKKAMHKGVTFCLPTDTVVATPVDTGRVNKKGRPVFEFQDPRVVVGDIPADAEGFDIGPETARRYAEILGGAKTILWNGPMGMFEDARFAKGTDAVALAVVQATEVSGAKSIIGGGDSVKALNKAGLGDKVTFASTGGGASLEFLEGLPLPGVEVLDAS